MYCDDVWWSHDKIKTNQNILWKKLIYFPQWDTSQMYREFKIPLCIQFLISTHTETKTNKFTRKSRRKESKFVAAVKFSHPIHLLTLQALHNSSSTAGRWFYGLHPTQGLLHCMVTFVSWLAVLWHLVLS